jgi:hypothetical protein
MAPPPANIAEPKAEAPAGDDWGGAAPQPGTFQPAIAIPIRRSLWVHNKEDDALTKST